MRQTTSWRSPLPRLASLVLLPVALLIQACFSPDIVTCESGLMCPAGYSCSADQKTCIMTGCGDAILQEGEMCDDGNTQEGDGCSADCKSNEQCGNGEKDVLKGELCDDGNTASGDGCSADCKSTEGCGNRVVDWEAKEICDDGNNLSGDGCSANCRSNETCGNGTTDLDEVCDDGNNVNGDGCSADCQVKGTGCGNGSVEPGLGEECDDSNGINDDACTNQCKKAKCGDGVVYSAQEQCDTRGASVSCNADCTLNACGDGIVNTKAGEECDGGGRDASGKPSPKDTQFCTTLCKFSRCGDGYTNPAADEKCDDGNTNACGTCDSTCTYPQTPRNAHGEIGAMSSNSFNDGEILSIGDGTTRLIFEFTRQQSAHGTNIRIDTRPANNGQAISAEGMAKRIMTAINDVSDEFHITATLDKSYVHLDNSSRGDSWSKGNTPIVSSVQNTAEFSFLGMAGGIDTCPKALGCKENKDCASNTCLSTKFCK